MLYLDSMLFFSYRSVAVNSVVGSAHAPLGNGISKGGDMAMRPSSTEYRCQEGGRLLRALRV
jgi:hypothetical protein